jgi:hypothetical protein
MWWRTVFVYLGMAVVAAAGLLGPAPAWAAWPTEVLPAEDVRSTKHNFFLNQDIAYTVDQTTEVCVFCHTPHGGQPSTSVNAVPLWNRALPDDTAAYVMYDSPNFDGKPSQTGNPLGVSLACLSCHDGTIGIDSLINAPGSGGFLSANKNGNQDSDVSLGFHTGATNGVDSDGSMSEADRPDCTPGAAGNCFQSPLGPQTNAEFFAGFPVGFSGTWGMAPFPNLGTNLSDDHPISMQIPDGTEGTLEDLQFAGIAGNFLNSKPGDGTGVTWLTRTGELNIDVRDRLRAYPSGGPNTEFVECASCHNPHTPRPLFLRLPNLVVSNQPATAGQLAPGVAGAAQPLASGGATAAWGDGTYVSNNPNYQSAICLSCHEK